MSDEQNDATLHDTTPLGKSVEEVEGEPQLHNPDDTGMGRRPGEPVNMRSALEHSLGMDRDGEPQNPDADRDSSEES